MQVYNPYTAPEVILSHKIVEIGAWNMDTTSFKEIAHGLSMAVIRSLSVTILKDNNVTGYHVPGTGTTYNTEIIASYSDISVTINRKAVGYFDSVNFDDAVMNRGYIIIHYTP